MWDLGLMNPTILKLWVVSSKSDRSFRDIMPSCQPVWLVLRCFQQDTSLIFFSMIRQPEGKHTSSPSLWLPSSFSFNVGTSRTLHSAISHKATAEKHQWLHEVHREQIMEAVTHKLRVALGGCAALWASVVLLEHFSMSVSDSANIEAGNENSLNFYYFYW